MTTESRQLSPSEVVRPPEKRYPVLEIFGPTVQGEGAMAGVFTNFIRFGGCDYRCLWCDSGFAVLPDQVRQSERLTLSEIGKQFFALPRGPEWVTLSGGNPLLHDLDGLVKLMHANDFKVAVETQGTLWKPWVFAVDHLTISPKPPSAGNVTAPHVLEVFLMQGVPPSTCIKIPVLDERDYEYAVGIHERFQYFPFYFSVVTRMGGLYGDFDGGAIDTTDDILRRYRWLVEWASIDPRVKSARAFPQLHALTWGHGRGH